MLLSPVLGKAAQDQSFKVLGEHGMGFARVDFSNQGRQAGDV
jgi:hypothetical protein